MTSSGSEDASRRHKKHRHGKEKHKKHKKRKHEHRDDDGQGFRKRTRSTALSDESTRPKTSASLSSTSPPPALLAQLGQRLLGLWLKASRREARAHVKGDTDSRDKAQKAKDAYFDAFDRSLEEHGLRFDPNRRAFVEYVEGLDVVSRQLFFQFFPVSPHASLPLPHAHTDAHAHTATHTYTLKILHPETRRNASTVAMLETSLIRRFAMYHGVKPRKVGVVVLGGGAGTLATGGNVCVAQGSNGHGHGRDDSGGGGGTNGVHDASSLSHGGPDATTIGPDAGTRADGGGGGAGVDVNGGMGHNDDIDNDGGDIRELDVDGMDWRVYRAHDGPTFNAAAHHAMFTSCCNLIVAWIPQASECVSSSSSAAAAAAAAPSSSSAPAAAASASSLSSAAAAVAEPPPPPAAAAAAAAVSVPSGAASSAAAPPAASPSSLSAAEAAATSTEAAGGRGRGGALTPSLHLPPALLCPRVGPFLPAYPILLHTLHPTTTTTTNNNNNPPSHPSPDQPAHHPHHQAQPFPDTDTTGMGITFTPLQLLQINGCDPGTREPKDVVTSLLHRTAGALGAVLVQHHRAPQPPHVATTTQNVTTSTPTISSSTTDSRPPSAPTPSPPPTTTTQSTITDERVSLSSPAVGTDRRASARGQHKPLRDNHHQSGEHSSSAVMRLLDSADPSRSPLSAGGLSSLRNAEGAMGDHRVTQVTPGLAWYVPRNDHGWLSVDSQILLATAIHWYRPHTILELGSWYGLSSRFILQRVRDLRCPCDLYCVDWYKNNAHYKHKLTGATPLDKFYFNFLRYETFHANLEPYVTQPGPQDRSRVRDNGDTDTGRSHVCDGRDTGIDCSRVCDNGDTGIDRSHVYGSGDTDIDRSRVCNSRNTDFDRSRVCGGVGGDTEPVRSCMMVKMDIHDAVGVLGEGEVDMVYVDAEKKTRPLVRLLRDIMIRHPRAVIVGDDYVFSSVRDAVRALELPRDRVITREESYMILPSGCVDEGGGKGRGDGGGDGGGSGCGSGDSGDGMVGGGKGRRDNGVNDHASDTHDSVTPSSRRPDGTNSAATHTPKDIHQLMAQMEAELRLPPAHAEICALLKQGRYEEALALADSTGIGATGELYCPGKTVVHEACRTGRKSALKFLEDLCKHRPEAIVANALGLTPFDYLTHEIDFS